ncbi:MAG: SusC/RagA family TonB-linked outer membrane protein, partial [Prevotella sp.]|nr:SusC/RagA family TonB-linked outer membrane protein [Prevotella sp.]
MNFIGIKVHPKLLLLLGLFFLSTIASAQSDVKISINKNNITIKEALSEIEKQSKMYVAYNESKLKSDKRINLNLTNSSLDDALNTILADTGFSYQLKNEYIIIVPKEEQIATREITGKVLDEADLPLAGASVKIKGTNVGTAADVDGNFSLRVSKNQTMVVSFLGYLPREINVTDRNSYIINMSPDSKGLEAVVVTALGIKRATKALSYNVQELNRNDLTAVKDANLVNSLSGKVAGVNINTSSSGVGGASKVVMRGAKSIEQSNNALYVIDGIPMYSMTTGGSGGRGDEFASSGTSEAIADINPEDIESLSVLTGAAAAALYGNQGANGAIIITTRKGIADRLDVTFSSNTEFLNPLVLPRFQTTYGTGDLLAQGGSTIRSWGNKLVPENTYGYSPKDDFFETGTVFTNALSVATGNAKNQTYFSAAAVNSNGIVPNNQYDRYNFTFRNTSKFLNDKMTLDFGVNYILQKDQNMINNGVYSNPISSAYLFPRGDDFAMTKVFERYDPSRGINVQYWPQGEGDFRLQNPYWIAYRNLKNNDKKRYMINAGLSYDVFDWLNVVGHARVDNTHNDYTEKLYASTNATLAGNNGQYVINKSHNLQVYGDVLANIKKDFDDFSLIVNAGASISDLKMDALKVEGALREDGIPNVFNVFQLDRDKRKESQEGWGS